MEKKLDIGQLLLLLIDFEKAFVFVSDGYLCFTIGQIFVLYKMVFF